MRDDTLGNMELLALRRAMLRPRGNICPITNSDGSTNGADAEFEVLWALNRRGLIKWVGSTAFLSDAGIEAVTQREPRGADANLNGALMVA